MMLPRPGVGLAACALGLLSAGMAAPPAQPPAHGSKHVFLLVGQSNMAGRGDVTPGDRTPHTRVLMLNPEEVWVPAVDPMHADKPDVVGVGLGRAFGIAVAEAMPGAIIGLVPAAVGGSPIDVWQPGAFYEPTRSHPWDDAIRRARLAMSSGTLSGILWHQGESDATPDLAPAYEAKLHDLIRRFRAELQAPEVPVIVGQLGTFSDRPWDASRARVDQAHRAVADSVAHVAYVSAEGLAHKGDGVHFDADSYRELGRRYAAAWLALSAGR
jgi:hypothetical protein